MILYLAASVLLAVFFFRGLWRYDGPPAPPGVVGRFYSSPYVGVDQKLDAHFTLGIRRQLNGGWFRAAWMFTLWLAIPTVFLSSGAMPDIVGGLLALPGGWALAVAAYVARKRRRGW